MSLRLFHIIFITISTLLMLYVITWSYSMWDYYADNSYLSYLILSSVSIIFLFIYGKNFIKKYKNI